jgi:hypothetical protein
MAALLAATKSVWPGEKVKMLKAESRKQKLRKPKAKLNFNFLLSRFLIFLLAAH